MRAPAIVAAVAVALTVMVGASVPAEAAPSCTVTRAEYVKIKRGMTLDRVARIVGCSGRTTYAATLYGTRYVDKTYKPATDPRYGSVSVSFKGKRGKPVRVTSKWVVW